MQVSEHRNTEVSAGFTMRFSKLQQQQLVPLRCRVEPHSRGACADEASARTERGGRGLENKPCRSRLPRLVTVLQHHDESTRQEAA